MPWASTTGIFIECYSNGVTSAEIADLGRPCLHEYEGRLNVRGIKPYHPVAVPINSTVPGNFATVSPDTLREGIGSVLERLPKKSSFTMSEPGELPPFKPVTADYKDLRITFFQASDVASGSVFVSVFCWYYPD